jgi:hypothetical protein
MTARQLIVPGAQPSRDANGRALPAKLYFYQPDTTTAATVYTSSALTTAHSFPILSDSAGRFEPIWADDANTFDVVWTDLNDVRQAAYDDIAPLSSAVLASASLAETAADSATSSATAAAASAVSAAATLAATEAFVEDFGDISSSVTAAQLAETNAEAAEVAAEAAQAAAVAAAASAQNIGLHSLWVPAQGFTTRTTNGAASGTIELSTNKIMFRTLDFDASTIEYAQFQIAMPKSWNEGTIQFRAVWSHAATTTNFKVSWGLQAVAISDDDAGDVAFGTAIYSNDEGGTTNDVYRSPLSTAVTIAGTPLAEDVVVFQVLRKADDATNDTLAVDARLHGIVIYFTTDAGNDA